MRPFRSDPSAEVDHNVRFSIEPNPTGGFDLHLGDEALIAQARPIEIVNHLLAAINRKAIERLASPAFHAGVVGIGSTVIAFPAPSGRGKSTLVAACLLSGFDYWSDEALIVDVDGQVLPYPRPIMLSSESARILGVADGQRSELPYGPAAFGGGLGQGEGRLGHLVALRQEPGTASLGALSPSEAVFLLLENCFNHYRQPAATYGIVTALAARAKLWTLTYQDPREAAGLLGRKLELVSVTGDRMIGR